MSEVDEYINAYMGETKARLKVIHELILEEIPKASVERICMRMPTYDLHGKWLLHFAGYKNHIGFYPQPDTIIAFQTELQDYKTSKGTVQFPLSKPLPLELIRAMVRYRVNQEKGE